VALEQTKEIKIRKLERKISKIKLVKELDISVADINEYILGDKKMPVGIKITPDENGMVIVQNEERYETPKYEGVFFNKLKSGDRTFYISYKDLKTNKKIDLKIGKESQGITEKYCENLRTELLTEMRLGNPQVKIKNKRVYSEVTTLDMIAEEYHKKRKPHMRDRKINCVNQPIIPRLLRIS
jgi:hypothetical protein